MTCLCGDPCCWSCGPAQGYDPAEEALGSVASAAIDHLAVVMHKRPLPLPRNEFCVPREHIYRIESPATDLLHDMGEAMELIVRAFDALDGETIVVESAAADARMTALVRYINVIGRAAWLKYREAYPE